MSQVVFKGLSLDEETNKLLTLIAQAETDKGEEPNHSRTIRKMIREKAEQLGIELPHPKPTKQKVAA